MTFDQGLVFAVVIAMMVLFAWGRQRYDLVAVLALLVSVAVGIVPPDQAFRDRPEGDGYPGLRARWQLCRSAQAVRSPRRQSAGSEPQGAAHRLSPALGQAQGRRRNPAQGQSRRDARDSRRTALPATRRTRSSHGPARELLPIAILAAAMALVAFKVVPVAVAFFGAAVILLFARSLSLREAYGHRTADSDHARRADPAQQRLVHHGRHGFDRVSALVRCDFLTPIGHQCNTLVMGPGGYRFGDYWRLGLPLSIIVLIVGVPLIAFFWSI